MGRIQIAAPAVEPVSLAEAKLHCRVDGNDDDSLLTALIVAARQQAEHRTGRALITQQWRFTLSGFSLNLPIELPMPVLQSVESITYLDIDGIRQTLASNQYQVVSSGIIGFVTPAYAVEWPNHRVQPDSVQINYTAGYGNAAAVPPCIKSWMMMAISTLYSQREGMSTGKQNEAIEIPRDFFAGLLDAYVIPRL